MRRSVALLVGLAAAVLAAPSAAAPRTTLVRDLRPGPESSATTILGTAGGAVIFTASDGAGTRGVWRADGTATGTRLLKATDAVMPGWVPQGRGNVGGALLFDGIGPELGDEPWRTDGTAAGTGPLADIAPGPAGSYPTEFSRLGGVMLFTAVNAEHRSELWRTDGTPAGTRMVLPMFLGPGVALRGRLYFLVSGSLWRSDGTAGGTVRVARVPTSARGLTAAGAHLFFTTDTSAQLGTLWASDGTQAGTRRVLLLHRGQHHWSIRVPLVALGRSVLLAARHGTSSTAELWRSDGTARGTRRVTTIPQTGLQQATTRGLAFFAGRDRRGSVLWCTDGTRAGTRTVYLQRGFASLVPEVLGVAGGTLYFSAADAAHGRELWSTRGSAATTRRVTDIAPGPASSEPGAVTAVGDALFLTAYESEHGRELWRVEP